MNLQQLASQVLLTGWGSRGLCLALDYAANSRTLSNQATLFLAANLDDRLGRGVYPTVDHLVSRATDQSLDRAAPYAGGNSPIRNTANHIRKAWLQHLADTGEMIPLPTDDEIKAIYKEYLK